MNNDRVIWTIKMAWAEIEYGYLLLECSKRNIDVWLDACERVMEVDERIFVRAKQ
jgi:hypothetical protein